MGEKPGSLLNLFSARARVNRGASCVVRSALRASYPRGGEP